MSAYITLVNFTDQGIRSVKDTVNRAKAARKALEAMGGRYIGVWWALGPYDLVVMSEAPDDETITRIMLAAGMQGNGRTTTMRIFSEEEMERIVQGLP